MSAAFELGAALERVAESGPRGRVLTWRCVDKSVPRHSRFTGSGDWISMSWDGASWPVLSSGAIVDREDGSILGHVTGEPGHQPDEAWGICFPSMPMLGLVEHGDGGDDEIQVFATREAADAWIAREGGSDMAPVLLRAVTPPGDDG